MKAAVQNFAIGKSRWLGGAVWASHMLGCVGVLWADLPAWLSGASLVGILASAGFSARINRTLALRFTPGSGLSVRAREHWLPVQVLPESRVLGWMVWLVYRQQDARGTQVAVVLPDSMHTEDFRRLKICLRWRVTTARGGLEGV